MHAHYSLRYTEPERGQLALVEARSEAHALQLACSLGAAAGEVVAVRLPPNAKRPLKRRFSDCPHCQFLKASGLDRESEAQKARSAVAFSSRK